MRIIYADSLFALNLAIDYILLLAAAKVSSVPLRRLRYLGGACLGAAYSVLAALPPMEFLTALPVKLAAAAAICLVSFGGERRFPRCCAAFSGVAAAFGGVVYAASSSWGGGGALLPVSMRLLVLSFAASWAVVTLAFRRSGLRAERRLCRVTVRFSGREARFTALLDTGNSLTDPVSGRRVMVADARTIAPLLGEGADDILSLRDPALILTALSERPGLRGRLRLVPYSAVGVGRSMLTALSPDGVTVDGEERNDLLTAFSPTPMGGDYDAII